ncbi:hypothetical protein [Actinomadura sp. 7K534]|uniref:hypothetical protein n=1 Tax=Actinomadura sp. 7K534 TaxID=2530366 RepID=UPI001047C518|nr:hypothetical protein [Actinomadura sp. 7K534]TDB97290.1 hypothetical protein E1266_06990 [Actinomadura sp. 7K534]
MSQAPDITRAATAQPRPFPPRRPVWTRAATANPIAGIASPTAPVIAAATAHRFVRPRSGCE